MMIKFRDFKETDRDYITRSLLFSFLGGSKEAQRVLKDAYMVGHNKVTNFLIDNCKIIVACDDVDEDLIFAFCIYENLKKHDVIHYIYIRKDFRKQGIVHLIFKRIQQNSMAVISHMTDEIRPARLKKFWDKVSYDPYLRSNLNGA